MASLSPRISRRSEGLKTRSSTRNNQSVAVAVHSGIHHNNTINNQTRHHQSNIGRKKRPRDTLEEEKGYEVKRTKISIEITSNPPQPKTRSLVIKSNASTDFAPALQRCASPPKQAESATQTVEPPQPKKPTDHHQKVVNGIKHELDRLQPNAVDLKDDKRKLRSQEGARFKSELSFYFPEYDEIIGNEPKEEYTLNLDTPIIIVDTAKTSSKQPPSPRKQNGDIEDFPLKEFPDDLFTNLNDAQRVDFSFMDKNYKEEGGEDPLSDEFLEQMHRKPERQERAIRNTDRGRAQHEKDQVVRLLEGLQGHDWLKLMGVSGVTDSKRKEYEPARDHFIRGCETILDKFRTWREEEKRRKLEKEQAQAEAEAEEVVDEGAESDGDPPDYSDVDASAARQLHEEAIARSGPPSQHSDRRRDLDPPRKVEQEKEFKSFFAKPYLREAALGKHRRSGRSIAAWGHPVPEVSVEDFDLPQEYRDEETLKAHARRKRRDRRISKS
ncbi:something about silencing, SAS, complex subunit 4-domain-containing protein [Tricladium varicosporioides]|nr:something about silencing, SAS, complex subunit 4-domain-containing protein [Hymenoscyphus varicosporioides]